MRGWGMAAVVGAAGRCAMTGVYGRESAFDRMGQSGGHARQDESPSQEAHDQYAGESPRPERDLVHAAYRALGRYAVSRSGASGQAKALSLLQKRNTAGGEIGRTVRRETINPGPGKTRVTADRGMSAFGGGGRSPFERDGSPSGQ
jgi:hypothetical protein